MTFIVVQWKYFFLIFLVAELFSCKNDASLAGRSGELGTSWATMKRMQIVIYQKNPSKTRHTNKKNEVVELFEKFRSKIEKSQRQKEVNIWSAILTLSFHELLINCSIH